jgi:hypothetical protein
MWLLDLESERWVIVKYQSQLDDDEFVQVVY